VDTFDFVLSNCAKPDNIKKTVKLEANGSSRLKACNVLHIILHERGIELQTGLYWRCPSLHEKLYSGWTELWSSCVERPKLHHSDQKSADSNIWKNGIVDVTWEL
jgi:hypothetical protein